MPLFLHAVATSRLPVLLHTLLLVSKELSFTLGAVAGTSEKADSGEKGTKEKGEWGQGL